MIDVGVRPRDFGVTRSVSAFKIGLGLIGLLVFIALGVHVYV